MGSSSFDHFLVSTSEKLSSLIFYFASTLPPSILLGFNLARFIRRSKPMNRVWPQPCKENENDGITIESGSVTLGSRFRTIESAQSGVQAHFVPFLAG
jgi:hypothetical protein